MGDSTLVLTFTGVARKLWSEHNPAPLGVGICKSHANPKLGLDSVHLCALRS